MEPLRVLVTHPQRTYREAIGNVLRALRPEFGVTIVTPGELGTAIDDVGPDLVLAGHAPPSGAASPRAWLELYPCQENYCVIHRDGRRTVVPDIDLDAILVLVDALLPGGPGRSSPAGDAEWVVSRP